jgi:hypothetical protein
LQKDQNLFSSSSFILSKNVSLGLYGDSRTQDGGKLNVIAGKGMTMITTKEDFEERMNKL